MVEIINYRPQGKFTDGLIDLINDIPESNHGKMVQVGVWRGDGTLIFAPRFKHIIDVDPWEGNTGKPYGFDVVLEHYKRATANLNNVDVMRLPSIEAAKRIADNSLDFVYIDGSHMYHNVKADIEAWRPKVHDGGYIGGHDYDMPGVKRAVDEMYGRPDKTFQDNSWLVFEGGRRNT